MSGRTAILLAFAAAAIACAGEEIVRPVQDPPPVEAPLFTSLGITPDTAVMPVGESLPLAVRLFDQRGQQMKVFSTGLRPEPGVAQVSWWSSAPHVAGVNSDGMVTAVAAGSATISVTVTVGQVLKTATMSVRTFKYVNSADVVLTKAPHGWEPMEAHVQAGGTVEWRTGPVSWSNIYLMHPTGVNETVTLNFGSAMRTFSDPGVIHYCSGACWDATDFGTIHVH